MYEPPRINLKDILKSQVIELFQLLSEIKMDDGMTSIADLGQLTN